MNRTMIVAIPALGLAVTAAVLVAGPMAPPAGVIGPTYKTLGEVEPRIAIGPTTTPGDADSTYRISQPGSYYLTGNVQGLGGKHGIKIDAVGAVTVDMQGYQLDGNVAPGQPPTQSGVYVATVQTRLTLRDGTIRGWGQSGVRAVSAQESLIEHIRADNNTERGFVLGDRAVVTACAVAGNGTGGIYTGTAAVITECTAGSNGLFGINGGTGSVIDRCAAFFNNDDGIVASSHCVLTRCTSNNNSADGFQVSANNRITECVANVNGDAGIRATIAGNDIQGNTVQGNVDSGIRTDQAGNFIARNTAKGNGINFDNSGLQTIGPIVVGGGAIASNSPWANFSF